VPAAIGNRWGFISNVRKPHLIQRKFQNACHLGSISSIGQQSADRERCGSQYTGRLSLEYGKLRAKSNISNSNKIVIQRHIAFLILFSLSNFDLLLQFYYHFSWKNNWKPCSLICLRLHSRHLIFPLRFIQRTLELMIVSFLINLLLWCSCHD